MKKPFIHLSACLLLLGQFAPGICNAQIETIASGIWTSPAIWSTGVVPGPDDDVIIRDSINFPAALESTVRVRNLTVRGEGRSASLIVHNSNIPSVGTELYISGNLTVESKGRKALFDSRIYTQVTIAGNVVVTRDHNGVSGDSTGVLLQGHSHVVVNGDFNVNYVAGSDPSREVRLNRGNLDIAGDLIFRNTGGSGDLYLELFTIESGLFSTLNCRDLVFEITGNTGGTSQDIVMNCREESIINVNRDLIVTNSGSGDIVLGLGQAAGNSGTLNIARNAYFTTTGTGTIAFNLRTNSKWDMNGNASFVSSNSTNIAVKAYENSEIYFGGLISPALPNAGLFNFTPDNQADPLLNTNNCLVKFDGSSPQVIPGNETYCRLITDNPTYFDLYGDIIVKKELSMANGIILAPNRLVNVQGSLYAGSSTAYICNGMLRRVLPSGTGQHRFDIGDTIRGYRPASISDLSDASSFEARYFPVDPSIAAAPGPYPTAIKDTTLLWISDVEYWIINRASGTGAGNITLGWNAYSNLPDTSINYLTITRWNGSRWTDEGACSHTGTLAAGELTTISQVANFSPFTLASVNLGVLLPVSITEFSARMKDRAALLSWKAEQALSTSAFAIERSINGRDYNEVETLSAGSTGGVHTYHYTDNGISLLSTPVLYYRLKMQDSDGRETYSKISTVHLNNDRNMVTLCSNPVKDKAVIAISMAQRQALNWRIYEPTGKLVKTGQWHLPTGNTSMSIDVHHLPKGIYYLDMQGPSFLKRFSLVKQ